MLPDYRLQGRERFQIEQMFMQVAGAEEQINWCGLQHILDTWMGAGKPLQSISLGAAGWGPKFEFFSLLTPEILPQNC